jgi:RecA-family ATPase
MQLTDNLPSGPIWEAAKAETNWLVWKREHRRRPDGTTKIAKVPADPASGCKVDRLQAAVLTFDGAEALVAAGRDFAGVGYVPRPGSAMVGYDLDNCRDPNTGRLDTRAEAVLACGETYCEISPSGTGLRVLAARGPEAPISGETQGVGLFEIVDNTKGKFFTVSGQGLGLVQEVNLAPQTRDHLLKQYSPQLSKAGLGGTGQGEKLALEEVESVLSQLNGEPDYNEWIKVGLAVKWSLGEEGFELWDRWSAKDDTYDAEVAHEKWDTLYPNGMIAGGYLMQRLEKEGGSLPEHLRKQRARRLARQEFSDEEAPDPMDAPDWDPFAVPEPDPGTPEGAAEIKRRERMARVRAFLKPVGADIATRVVPPRSMIVEGLLAQSVFGLVGPGAVSKTTLALHLSIRTILGLDWWGFPVVRPGPVVFYSAEDDALEFHRRIQALLKTMGLSPAQQALVGESLHVIDLGPRLITRLVEADGTGNMRRSEMYEEAMVAAEIIRPSLTWMDPAVYFGPGEQFLNTGEAALMKAGRTIASAGDGAVGFIHHTGQAAAREKIADMYAGRGGSAFADNARGLFVMHRVQAWEPAEMSGITEADVLDDRVSAVSLAKFSYGKRHQGRLFVKHSAASWYDLELIRGNNLAAMPKQVMAEREAEADATAVYEYLKGLPASARPGETELGNRTILDRHGQKISRNRIKAAVTRLADEGRVNKVQEKTSGAPKVVIEVCDDGSGDEERPF